MSAAHYCGLCNHCDDGVLNCGETEILQGVECGGPCGEIIPRLCANWTVEDYCANNQVSELCFDYLRQHKTSFEAANAYSDTFNALTNAIGYGPSGTYYAVPPVIAVAINPECISGLDVTEPSDPITTASHSSPGMCPENDNYKCLTSCTGEYPHGTDYSCSNQGSCCSKISRTQSQPDISECIRKHARSDGSHVILINTSCESVSFVSYPASYYLELNPKSINSKYSTSLTFNSRCSFTSNTFAFIFNPTYIIGVIHPRAYYLLESRGDEATLFVRDEKVMYGACFPDETDRVCYRGDGGGGCVYEGFLYEDGKKINLDGDPQLEWCRVNSPGVWHEAVELICDDFIDNDEDLRTDYRDTDCQGIITGIVKDGVGRIGGARVEATASFPYNNTVHRLQFVTATDDNGVYSMFVWGGGTYDVIASKPGYAPVLRGDVFVGIGSIVDLDFNLTEHESTCGPDCTRAGDDRCDPTCDNWNGCVFWDDLTKAACAPDFDNHHTWKQKGQRVLYGDEDKMYVQCCTGSPYELSTPTKAELQIDAKNIVRVTRLVRLDGEMVKMVVVVYN